MNPESREGRTLNPHSELAASSDVLDLTDTDSVDVVDLFPLPDPVFAPVMPTGLPVRYRKGWDSWLRAAATAIGAAVLIVCALGIGAFL